MAWNFEALKTSDHSVILGAIIAYLRSNLFTGFSKRKDVCRMQFYEGYSHTKMNNLKLEIPCCHYWQIKLKDVSLLMIVALAATQGILLSSIIFNTPVLSVYLFSPKPKLLTARLW